MCSESHDIFLGMMPTSYISSLYLCRCYVLGGRILGRKLPQILLAPRPIIDVASLDGGIYQEKYEARTTWFLEMMGKGK